MVRRGFSQTRPGSLGARFGSMKYYLAFVCALLIAVPLAWLPARTPDVDKSLNERVEKAFKKHDRNHDGVIEGDEITGKEEKDLHKIDKNADGKITRSELETWLGKQKSHSNWPGKGLRRGRGKSVLKIWGHI